MASESAADFSSLEYRFLPPFTCGYQIQIQARAVDELVWTRLNLKGGREYENRRTLTAADSRLLRSLLSDIRVQASAGGTPLLDVVMHRLTIAMGVLEQLALQWGPEVPSEWKGVEKLILFIEQIATPLTDGRYS